MTERKNRIGKNGIGPDQVGPDSFARTTGSDRASDGLLDGGLDALFDAARQDAPMPSGDFMARIEAQALQSMPVAGPRVPEPRGLGGRVFELWAQLRQAVGGWPGVAGLAAACAAGIWFGVSPPDSLSSYLSTDSAALDVLGVDPLSGYDLALVGG